MALSAFDDKAHPPDAAEVRGALGAAWKAWSALIELCEAEIGPLEEVWGFTSKSTGWGMRLVRGKRVLVYMTPREGSFLVSLALGEKAVAAARAAKLPAAVLEAIDAAPKYAEGRGVRVEVETLAQVKPLAKLAAIKDAH